MPVSRAQLRQRTGQAALPSILFDQPEDRRRIEEPAPAFFADLNLDQVLAAMVAGREEYHLEPFFSTPLRDVDAVRYRHEVLRDLEQRPLLKAVDAFAQAMATMRERLALAGKLYYHYQRERWFLDAVTVYCDAVRTLAERLARLDLQSRGLPAFRDYLAGYLDADAFGPLAADARAVTDALAEVRYTVHIRGGRVTVSRDDGEPDYSAEVERTFAKFQQGAAIDYRVGFPAYLEMNHIEAQILDRVARLYPDPFRALDQFCARHQAYLDATVTAFDREIQFYLAYLQLIEPLKAAGLHFCYPQVSVRSNATRADDAFDLALAQKLVGERAAVVCNDVELRGPERILVVTGPNQGGKTTFARMVGQLHHLASLGLPVPGTQARLFLPDRLFAHFERAEDITTLRGKLEDELVRIRDILHQATGDSLVVMNESFSSTTLSDALFLGTQVMRRLVGLDLLGVYVTFVHELASLSEATVSMVSTVDPGNPAVRTFTVVRRPADGLAYAAAIAEKYGLTYESVRRRMAS